MSSESPTPSTTQTIQLPCESSFHRSLCWAPVLTGTVVTLAIQILLTALGAGVGLAMCRRLADASPVAHFGVGTAMAWSLFVIIAFSFGGWVAGLFSACPRSGLLHGALVWSLTLFLVLPWLALGTALTVNREVKNQNENRRVSSQSLAVAEADLAKSATQRCHEQLRSFVVEAVESITTNAAPKASTRAEREVGFAVAKLFAPGNTDAFPANRLDAINVLAVYTVMSLPDATITIDAWSASRKNLQIELDKLKAEMDNRAVAAEQTASATSAEIAAQRAACVSRVGRWSFFALLIGLVGASLSGRCGARCASRNFKGQ